MFCLLAVFVFCLFVFLSFFFGGGGGGWGGGVSEKSRGVNTIQFTVCFLFPFFIFYIYFFLLERDLDV